jgi:hypothetical protein
MFPHTIASFGAFSELPELHKQFEQFHGTAHQYVQAMGDYLDGIPNEGDSAATAAANGGSVSSSPAGAATGSCSPAIDASTASVCPLLLHQSSDRVPVADGPTDGPGEHTVSPPPIARTDYL